MHLSLIIEIVDICRGNLFVNSYFQSRASLASGKTPLLDFAAAPVLPGFSGSIALQGTAAVVSLEPSSATPTCFPVPNGSFKRSQGVSGRFTCNSRRFSPIFIAPTCGQDVSISVYGYLKHNLRPADCTKQAVGSVTRECALLNPAIYHSCSKSPVTTESDSSMERRCN